MISFRRLTGVLLLCGTLFLVACKQKEQTDYCANHYLFHADHIESLATLDVSLEPGGLVRAGLSIPVLELGVDAADLARALKRTDEAFELITESDCEAGKWNIQSNPESLLIDFESRCGDENNLKQVNVKLLDLVPELDEIEVRVTTPATSKHFAISRQCSAAIFRLASPGGKSN